jgi:hypothetical protein
MAFLLKRWDGQDIAKKRYCLVQNGTYGQPKLLQAMGFYLTVLFMGFLPRITMAVTVVYILVVLC